MTEQRIFTAGRTIALIGATLLAISAFLPWGESAYVSVTGVSESGDGLIQISIGILAFLLLFIRRITIWFSLFLGLVGLTIGIVDYVVMYDAIQKVTEGKMGLGLYTTLGATGGIILGTIVEILEERNRKLKKKLAYLDDK